jgi:hypothetical protein
VFYETYKRFTIHECISAVKTNKSLVAFESRSTAVTFNLLLHIFFTEPYYLNQLWYVYTTAERWFRKERMKLGMAEISLYKIIKQTQDERQSAAANPNDDHTANTINCRCCRKIKQKRHTLATSLFSLSLGKCLRSMSSRNKSEVLFPDKSK